MVTILKMFKYSSQVHLKNKTVENNGNVFFRLSIKVVSFSTEHLSPKRLSDLHA